jgi:hypothetical protein
MPKAFTPPADADEYRCFSIPGDPTKDLQVGMIDFRPGDRGTVHHIVPYLDVTGASAKLDRNGDGYSCFGGPDSTQPRPSAPGRRARVIPLPEGTAIRIPKGARVVMQVHYHRTLAASRTGQIGLYRRRASFENKYTTIFWSTDLIGPAIPCESRSLRQRGR